MRKKQWIRFGREPWTNADWVTIELWRRWRVTCDYFLWLSTPNSIGRTSEWFTYSSIPLFSHFTLLAFFLVFGKFVEFCFRRATAMYGPSENSTRVFNGEKLKPSLSLLFPFIIDLLLFLVPSTEQNENLNEMHFSWTKHPVPTSNYFNF